VFHDHGEPVSQHYVTNDALIFAGNMAVTEANSSRTQYYWEIYTLMGDPSVMTYLGTPQPNNVIHDAAILMTSPSITVSADPGSYVGISFEGQLMGAGYVDESGQVTIPLAAFSTPGTADIVVTCQNHVPYISTIQIITPSGPYVIYNATTLSDASGNGIVENGETVQMGLTLVNVGPDDAFDVLATITTDDPYVTITDNNEAYGTITHDWGTGYVENGFAFEVASDVPDQHKIVFDLSVNGTARDTWTGSFQVPVKAPVLEFVSASMNDAVGGDNNGILDPGETAEVVVTLRNSGTGQAFNAVANLSVNDQYVTATDSYGTFGTIDSVGATADNAGDTYELVADGSCPIGYGVPVTLQVDAGGGYTIELPFNITVGDRVAFFVDDFSYDQGWTGLGGSAEWQMGSVSGAGGDPSQDHSPTADNAVLGNDLTSVGTYANSITGTQWVTSPALDCGSMSGVIMSFYRQLGVESSQYDHAYFQAFDGSSWVTLYENPSTTVQESSWSLQEYDLSAIADGNPNFQIRFGLGSTDGSQTYAGWNIDDIEIKGYGRIGYPALTIDETTLSDSLLAGDSTVKQIAIKNTGEGSLRIWFACPDPWIGFSEDQQILSPGDSIGFNVTLFTAALGCGDHTCSLNWTSNDATAQSGTIDVFMHIYEPDIAITETSIDQALSADALATYPLVITNNGPGRLTYQVGCQMNQKGATPAVAAATTTQVPVGYQAADGDKSNATEPFYAAQVANFGGPDTYGHSWVDSDDQGGPAYGWVDISTLGTPVTLGDDAFSDAIPIGFGFPYYDSVYTQLYIGSNGILTFDVGSGSRNNLALPVGSMKSLLAMYWDDLDPRKGGNIYYYEDVAAGRFVVSFVDIKFYYSTTGTGTTSFQAILNADGTILLQYGTMDPGSQTLQSATIGIQNADENDALQVVYNAPYMHNNLAIAITAQHWLSALPAGGVIEPFSNATVTVKFDATDMEDGTYAGSISVSSNDPDTPSWSIPASMQVTSFICGDINGDGVSSDISDLIYLVDYSFNDGAAPPTLAAADVDGSGELDVSDLIYLAEYQFGTGPAPQCQ
ncbi:MAG TPA: C25 family peptidase C-terminal domain-containing protein, partial [candidate division Zixibacteria bacterium]|nr:C25 family peptidase C-terminal domain-containing protein [candidate division Zixibacteria bacterium]